MAVDSDRLSVLIRRFLLDLLARITRPCRFRITADHFREAVGRCKSSRGAFEGWYLCSSPQFALLSSSFDTRILLNSVRVGLWRSAALSASMLGSFVPQCRRSKRSTSKASRLIDPIMEVPSKRQKVQHEENAQFLHDPVPLVNNVQEATEPYQVLDNLTPEGKVELMEQKCFSVKHSCACDCKQPNICSSLYRGLNDVGFERVFGKRRDHSSIRQVPYGSWVVASSLVHDCSTSAVNDRFILRGRGKSAFV